MTHIDSNYYDSFWDNRIDFNYDVTGNSFNIFINIQNVIKGIRIGELLVFINLFPKTCFRISGFHVYIVEDNGLF